MTEKLVDGGALGAEEPLAEAQAVEQVPRAAAAPTAIRNHAAFIWSIADLLRGDYKQSEYGKVILPMVVLRRLDCVLEPTKEAVLSRNEALKGSGIENVEPVLRAVSGEQFYNVSKLDLPKLLDDPANIADNLHAYIQGFSGGARQTSLARIIETSGGYAVQLGQAFSSDRGAVVPSPTA